MYWGLINHLVTSPTFLFSSPSITATLLSQYRTYSHIFQPRNTTSAQQPVGQKKLIKTHLIFSWPYKKNKKFSYPFACLSQSSLRSGLIDSGSTALLATVSLSRWGQPRTTWKITSRSLLKNVFISQTRKSPACLLQVSISTNLGNMPNRQKNLHW